eukprot:1148191-Pelagomonas_calceolata.AAC.5
MLIYCATLGKVHEGLVGDPGWVKDWLNEMREESIEKPGWELQSSQGVTPFFAARCLHSSVHAGNRASTAKKKIVSSTSFVLHHHHPISARKHIMSTSTAQQQLRLCAF